MKKYEPKELLLKSLLARKEQPYYCDLLNTIIKCKQMQRSITSPDEQKKLELDFDLALRDILARYDFEVIMQNEIETINTRREVIPHSGNTYFNLDDIKEGDAIMGGNWWSQLCKKLISADFTAPKTDRPAGKNLKDDIAKYLDFEFLSSDNPHERGIIIKNVNKFGDTKQADELTNLFNALLFCKLNASTSNSLSSTILNLPKDIEFISRSFCGDYNSCYGDSQVRIPETTFKKLRNGFIYSFRDYILDIINKSLKELSDFGAINYNTELVVAAKSRNVTSPTMTEAIHYANAHEMVKNSPNYERAFDTALKQEHSRSNSIKYSFTALNIEIADVTRFHYRFDQLIKEFGCKTHYDLQIDAIEQSRIILSNEALRRISLLAPVKRHHNNSDYFDAVMQIIKSEIAGNEISIDSIDLSSYERVYID